MNDKGNENQEGLFIPMNERALVALLGILLSGLAHSAPENGVAKECTIQNGSGSSSQHELKCTPLDNPTKDMTSKKSSQNQPPIPEKSLDTHTSRQTSKNSVEDNSITSPETIEAPSEFQSGNGTHFDNRSDGHSNIESINSTSTPIDSSKKEDMSSGVIMHDHSGGVITTTNDSVSDTTNSGNISSEKAKGDDGLGVTASPDGSESGSVNPDDSKSGSAAGDANILDNTDGDNASSPDKTNDAVSGDDSALDKNSIDPSEDVDSNGKHIGMPNDSVNPDSSGINDIVTSPDTNNDAISGSGASSDDSKGADSNETINSNNPNGAAASDAINLNDTENNSATSPDRTNDGASGGGATSDGSNGVDSSEETTSDDSKTGAATSKPNVPDTTNNGSMAPNESSGESTTTPDNINKSNSDNHAVVTGDPKQLATDGAASHSPTIKPKAEIFNLDKAAALAEENEDSETSNRDLFTVGGESNRTSDHYQARTYSLSYRNRRREWFWPWQEAEEKEGLDWGLDIHHTEGNLGSIDLKAINVEATLGGYLSEGTYLQARIGHHELDTDSGDRTITPHQVKVMFGLDKDFSVQLENNRDFIYTGGSVTGGITKQLTATNNLGSFRWHPNKRIRIEGQAGYSEYDQDNEERQGNLSALYGISPDWPWIWAGLGVEALSFHRNVTDYWSPDRFFAYGLRLESSFPINDRLTGNLSNSLNRQQEKQLYNEDYTYGNGYELSAGLQYRLFSQVHARLEISKSKSLQNGTSWRSSNIFFSLNMPLF